MKKILGLDLGIASIGWAMIQVDEDWKRKEILGMGVRVVPLGTNEMDEFKKGQPVTTNQDRRMKKGIRKGYYRYQLRKFGLKRALKEMGMEPGEELMLGLNNEGIYNLRAKAAREKIALDELGRVLYHINQKRGYKSNRKTDRDEGGKKLSDYLQDIKDNAAKLEAADITIGQFFAQQLAEDPNYRIKGRVFPRACYVDEFDRIWECQQRHYPQVLTESRRKRLRDGIIFMQRRLKSQKGRVALCQFEEKHRVAPKSSPLFQLAKVWEGLNNVRYTNLDGKEFQLDHEQKQVLAEHLLAGTALSRGKLSWPKACKLIQINARQFKADGKTSKEDLEGDTTMMALREALSKAGDTFDRNLLKFELQYSEKEREAVDKESGEISKVAYNVVDPSVEKEPLYQLWHAIYSIEEDKDLHRVLVEKFGFSEVQADELSKIDFTRQGYGSRSAKALRKLIPSLLEGLDYSEASKAVGYNHSDSKTKEENAERVLQPFLEVIKKNELRSPVVEKILNQMIHVVNEIMADPRYGRPDEIRVELARDLKMNAKDKQRAIDSIKKNEKGTQEAIDEIKRHNVKVTANLIKKVKIWISQGRVSPYTGNILSATQVIVNDRETDLDHIIPQSRLFDDSVHNLVVVESSENAKKSNMTALEYMRSLGPARLEQFKELVTKMEATKDGISARKLKYLLMEDEKIPTDFVNRDMALTRYVTREATKRLNAVCYNVEVTSGMLSARLRQWWGWDEVLKRINFAQYERAGLVEEVTDKDGKPKKRIRKEYWSKRDDHRHHAIDALVAACTQQGFVQRLNTLNANPEFASSENKLKAYFQDQRPFSTKQVIQSVSQILISLDPRKRVVSKSRNRNGNEASQGQVILAPRGALSEETVYGRIKVPEKRILKLSPGLNLADVPKIVPKRLRQMVEKRLEENGGDPAKAFKGYAKDPILYLEGNEEKALTVVEVADYRDAYVVKYGLDGNFKEKDADSIIDGAVKKVVKERLAQFGGDPKKAFADLENNPIWLNREKGVQVKRVRCDAGLKKVATARKNEDGEPISFVVPGNNHHVAIYRDADGKLHESTVTFLEAVQRKQLGLPVVVHQPASVWDMLLAKAQHSLSEETWASLEASLPKPEWEFVLSMNINEMFVFNMSREELEEAIARNDHAAISPNLYRVQKLSEKDYYFRQHRETKVDDKFGENKDEKLAMVLGKVIRIRSCSGMEQAIKVKISRLGQIEIT